MKPLCLDDGAIDDFVHARLPEAARAEAEEHLDACPECSAIVRVLAGGATLSGPTRDAADDADTADAEDAGAPASARDEPLLAKGAKVGRHTIVEALGEGAMGVVYLAHDPELDRDVALKVLRARGSQTASERLVREAQAMAKIAHPNVVAVYDVGRLGDAVHIAMEHVRGQTLRAWLREVRPASERVAVVVAAGRGLAAAHEAGLVHRDFKPENVLVGADGRARVTDFGLARLGEGAGQAAPTSPAPDAEDTQAALTQTGALLGTPAYMAPEQWRGEAATASTDQFAFAIVLFEALAGRRPFEGSSAAELREAASGAPTFPDASPELGRLRAVLTRALSAAPEARFASMHELLAAVAAALAPARPSRTGRVLAALAVVGALVTLVLVARSWRERERDRCGAGAALAAQVADDARAARIHAASTARGAWTAGAADRAVAELRAYSTEWAAAHRATCEATEVRREQSPALLDARMHCLRRALGEARALGERLERADEAAWLHAPEATAALPSIAACADTASLAAVDARPTGDRATRLEALEASLARAHATAAAGSASPAAVEEGRALTALAVELGYRPAVGEARLHLATMLRRSGALAEAAKEANAALVAAEGGRDDRAAVRVWLELLALRAEEGQFTALLGSEGPATAALARVGAAPELAADLRFLLGVARTNVADYEGAQRDLEASLAAREAGSAAHGFDVSRTLTALGNLERARGELPSALAFHQRALEADRATLGAEHPALARHHHNLGGVLRLQGKLDDAEAHYLRALALEKRGGASELVVGRTENSLGLIAIARADWAAAGVHLERARGLLGAHPDRALALGNLGLVEAAAGHHLKAIEDFDAALAVYHDQQRDDATVAAVRAERAKSERAFLLATSARGPARAAPPAARPSAAPSAQVTARPAPGSYGAAQTFDTGR
ncbi:MAG TPA: serine/threonine-protein kinase [Polyangiaceae bacterium]|nr:serine/threonine-protein kinase [Polyangiaceae bacterium]